MNIYKVGEPFPGPVPPQDGVFFEVGPDGDMVLLIQFQKPTQAEKEALAAGFKSYSYYESKEQLSCWVFKFSSPVGYIDAPFHAGLYSDGRIDKLLSGAANALQIFILDGNIIQGIRYVGLHPVAIKAFHDTVAKQTATGISREQYDAAINELYRFSSKDIYEYGKIFSHKEELH